MKKTIEFENKVIAIFCDEYINVEMRCDTFEEAYETMKNKYTDENGIGWDIEDWNEEFDFEETKGKFEAYGYVEFCDEDKITTTEQLLKEALSAIL
jgi:hypothetical protein